MLDYRLLNIATSDNLTRQRGTHFDIFVTENLLLTRRVTSSTRFSNVFPILSPQRSHGIPFSVTNHEMAIEGCTDCCVENREARPGLCRAIDSARVVVAANRENQTDCKDSADG